LGIEKTMKSLKKKKRYRFLFREVVAISIIFLAMGCVPREKVEPLPEAIPQNLIKNIEVVNIDGGERVIIKGESPLVYCSFKFIPKPLELVVDIPRTELSGDVPTTIAVGDNIIKDIVNTQQEGNTQISIALNKLVRYQIQKEGNLLYIDIGKPGPLLAREEKKKEIEIVEKVPPPVKEDKREKEIEIVKEVPLLAKEEKKKEVEIVEKVPPPAKEEIIPKELSPAQSLIDIFVDKSQKDKVILKLKADGRLGDFNTFNMEKPTRLVIDLWNIKRKFPQKALLVDSPYLKQVRFGDSPDKVRVVLDFPTGDLPSYRINRVNDELIIVLGRVGH